ncbi:MAG: high-potential iron-sulfur protein [Rhodanobacteraceae bacterium]
MSDSNHDIESRRRFLKIAAGTATVAAVAGVSGVFPRVAKAADAPHLGVEDPMAVALKYVEDAKTTQNPKHVAGANCSNCKFFHGKEGDMWGPCDLFPGKAVNAKGWCVSHSPKT